MSAGTCSASPSLAEVPAPLELLVLGSGGPGATGRAASSYLLLLDGTPRIIVDAGPGSFVTLGKADVSLQSLDLALLTHLHIDHVGELPGIFKARVVSASGPVVFNVWGPSGAAGSKQDAYFPSTRRYLELLFGRDGAFAYLRDFSAPMTMHGHDIPVTDRGTAVPRAIYRENKLKISAVAGHHGDAPAVIYRIDYAGKSITFSGDIDAQGLASLRGIARGCDLLVFNSVVLDPPGSAPILYTLHTPPRTIGEIAQQAAVHGVLLSHLSPATDRQHDQVLDSIRANYQGPVRLAEDGMRLTP
jgi:ribonuclease BN (tRNA processing enzyme)